MTSNYKGGFKSDNGNRMSFIMPIFTFGHHTGDNYFELDRSNNGFIFSIVSRKGSKEVLRTSSEELYKDKSFEEWDIFIDEIIKKHIIKPEYSIFAAGDVGRDFDRKLTGQGRGCLGTFAVIFLVSILTLLFVV